MKLFKKLAAAVLAAALALTMVGCSGGNSYAMQNELLKLTIDQMTDRGKTVTHTTKADDLAAALLAAADTAAAQEENKGKDPAELLLDEKVIEAAGIDPATTPCKVSLIDNVQFKSSDMAGEFVKRIWMMNVTNENTFVPFSTFDLDPPENTKYEVGAATHKIGDKNYILILITYTPTARPL